MCYAYRVGRHKEFIPEVALARAQDLFRRRGFEASSIDDLVKATGVGRASLYGAFGSKQALYLSALDDYCQNAPAPLLAELESADPVLPGIRAALSRMVQMQLDDPDRKGCMVVAAAIERPHDAETSQRVAQSLARVEAAFENALRRARHAGELAPESDPVALARFLLTTMQGLRVIARATPDGRRLDDTIAVAIAALR
jgi:TetR/AcrR family transcriptional regulator, transcriptional repressor for nem operon